MGMVERTGVHCIHVRIKNTAKEQSNQRKKKRLAAIGVTDFKQFKSPASL